ncbi:hypothetical protein JX266_007280 [Neoarthrinium moseri]|nr:hypothetical protein JX266_007280 [Neoarthrinium moseri]
MIQTSVKELGPLSTMVANAGIAQVKALLDLTEQDFEHMLAVNVTGLHNCYAEAAKQMISQCDRTPDNPGKLIGAASIVAFKPFALLSHYSAKHNITVNAYAPGIVGTAMWEIIDSELAKKKGQPKGSMIKKYVHDSTALGRVSVPEDVSKLVSFLASSDSNFVTGQTQVVDGGIIYT